ncbi:hypothetical protein Tco_0465541 [Tanacetum coccineum]
MAFSLSHTIDKIKALVEKLIDGDIVRQKAITELAVQFDNASTTKDDMRKAYEKCNDIPQENRALIDTFLKQESDKDYEMHLALRLRTEQEKEVILVNNLLCEMTRYLLQKLSRAEEETRVHLLPLDEPLNNYGLHALLMTSESDTRITTALEAVREEVLRTINEKQELINNYQVM